MITRDEAVVLLQQHVPNVNLQKHCYSVEAAMAECARELNHDAARWAMAGLLHDLDYEYTAKEPEKHGLVAMQLLQDANAACDEEILHAIRSHGGNEERTSLMDHVLYAVDPLTGLIIAAALLHPDRAIASLTPEFIVRRMKEKGFAKGANRDAIRSCEQFMPLETFIGHVLTAMRGIKPVLGL